LIILLELSAPFQLGVVEHWVSFSSISIRPFALSKKPAWLLGINVGDWQITVGKAMR